MANLKPATADAFAKELKIICDTYELDGVFFDDEYTALVSPPPTGFYAENTAEAAADLMFRVKRMMPDRWVIAYQLGAIWDLSGEGCEFEADDKTWLPGDYIDYVMVDYSESAWASLAQFRGFRPAGSDFTLLILTAILPYGRAWGDWSRCEIPTKRFSCMD